MTILIHAVIFAIIINVYGPDLEGFQVAKTGNAPTCGIPTCSNGAYLTCSDGGGLGQAIPCPKTGNADVVSPGVPVYGDAVSIALEKIEKPQACPLCPNPPACPKCPECPTNQSAASKFCTIM